MKPLYIFTITAFVFLTVLLLVCSIKINNLEKENSRLALELSLKKMDLDHYKDRLDDCRGLLSRSREGEHMRDILINELISEK